LSEQSGTPSDDPFSGRRPTSHERMSGVPWDASYHGGTAPWDIGRPQPAIVRLASEGGFAGAVLDAGCGTGENALHVASLELSVLGVDVAETALAIARAKADQREIVVEFAAADAFQLERLGRRFETVVDVGGATGNMLAAILSRHVGPRGVLFDRPHVVRDAPALLKARGVEERVTIEPGNFFDSVPAGGDAYVLSHIIHDWTEDQCLTILGHCRKAMKPDGRLLIVEMVLPAGDTPHPGKILDMVMLVIPGGQERTEAEYAALLGKAGFRLTRVVPTASAVGVVEAVVA